MDANKDDEQATAVEILMPSAPPRRPAARGPSQSLQLGHPPFHRKRKAPKILCYAASYTILIVQSRALLAPYQGSVTGQVRARSPRPLIVRASLAEFAEPIQMSCRKIASAQSHRK